MPDILWEYVPCISLFAIHSSAVWYVALLLPFYMWGKSGKEKCDKLCKVTQFVRDRAKISI